METNKDKALDILNSLQNSLVGKLKEYGVPTENITIKYVKEKVLVLFKGEVDLNKAAEKIEVKEIKLAKGLAFNLSGRGSLAEYFMTWDQDSSRTEEEQTEMRSGLYLFEKAVDSIVAEFVVEFKKKFDDIIVATIEGKSGEELIPNKAKKLYQAAGGLRNIENWKAQLIIGNNLNRTDELKVGHFDSVGYVMVNVDTGALVPVARGDEHHTGFDLLRHLISKKIVPAGDYYPIFRSHTYVYDGSPSGVAKAVRAFKIWRAAGGENIPVESASSHGVTDFMLRVDDYIRMNGQLEMKEGELYPVGKQIIRHLERLAQSFVRLHAGEAVKESMLFNETEALFGALKGTYHYLDAQKLQSKLPSLKDNGDLKGLEELVFSHNGYKNLLHMELKKNWDNYEKNNKDKFWIRTDSRVFGDVKFAINELNRLGYQY